MSCPRSWARTAGATTARRFRESLDRIADSVIYAKNPFYDNETEQFRTHRFIPWSVHFATTRRGRGRSAERHVSKFHEILVRWYNSWFFKTLDTNSFFALKPPMAKSRRRDAGERRSCSAGEKEREESGRRRRSIGWEAHNLRAASLVARYSQNPGRYSGPKRRLGPSGG